MKQKDSLIVIGILLWAVSGNAQEAVAASTTGNVTPGSSTGSVVTPSTTTAKQEEKFSIPAIPDSKWKDVCVNDNLNLPGDFQSWNSSLGEWSVGPAVSTQLIKYDMAKKQAGFNTSVGAGASFRFYRNITIKEDANKEDRVGISRIRRECRQSSYDLTKKEYRAAPLFSITPTLYATKPTDSSDLAVQPAILVGFFEDILNFGVGFNLTGPPAEKGHVFLLMSIGTGFSF